MEYIPDKQLYKAVMFALDMCRYHATDQKIKIAADYYKVNEKDVFRYVRGELWKKEKTKAKEKRDVWHTVFNPWAIRLLGGPNFENYAFVCPKCGNVQYAHINSFETDRIYVKPCPSCGFVDWIQRRTTRKDVYERLTKREASGDG